MKRESHSIKERTRREVTSKMGEKCILLLCETIVPAGGLLRFERLAKYLKKYGYIIYICPLGKTEKRPFYIREMILCSRNEAERKNWYATMIPGAGFSPETIEEFGTFRDRRYGLRIQHILSDKTRKERFVHVNRVFRPDKVVFNNRWEESEREAIALGEHYTLVGAVDTRIFYPLPYRPLKNTSDTITIGTQANKNPWYVFDLIKSLPENYRAKIFGSCEGIMRTKRFEAYRDLVESGRLECVGVLDTDGLRRFYSEVDIVFSLETFAGWSNVSAEALACGLPLLCTIHGTSSFAVHNVTAVVLNELTFESIEREFLSLVKDRRRLMEISRNGREKILEFDWEKYVSGFLEILEHEH